MATAVFEDLIIPEGVVQTYTQNSGSGVSGALEFAPTSGQPQPSLINYGEIRFQPDAYLYATQVFIRFATNSFWNDARITNYGTISAVIPTADYVKALYASSWSPDLWNAGTIVAQAKLYAIGYESWDSSLTIDNLATGSISVTARDQALGLYLANGATITNAGDIIARATGPSGTAYAISLPNADSTITNSGLIQAIDNSANPNAIAIGIGSNDNTIVNSGTIRGDVAIGENNPYGYNSRASVQNTGLIEGLISLAHGFDRVTNSGQIVGDVDLGADDDIYDGRLGSIVGTVLAGDGNDLLLGGAGRDTLNGGSGDDALFGRGGDTLTGGVGRDIFVYTAVTRGAPAETITDFVSGTDRIDLTYLAPTSVTISGSTISAVTAAGTLTIKVTGSVSLADIVTGATGTVTGTSVKDTLVAGPGGVVLNGGDGADLLVGGTGNDRLDGGTGTGAGSGNGAFADLMWGGAGDDTYVVNESADVVVENPGGGYDTIELIPARLWQRMYTLPDNIERAIGGGAEGNALDNVMIGSSEGDRILGRDGNDSIDGGSGDDALSGDAGDDRIDGGAGLDTVDYFTAIAGVTVRLGLNRAQDTGGAGIDTLTSIENLFGSNHADTLTGNGGANVLTGGEGDDILNGGAGADVMQGGDGNDTFFVDNVGDRVEDAGPGGTDRVIATVDYVLPDDFDLVLRGAAKSGTGNFLDNTIQGSSGDNRLSGLDGADTLNGGDGIDTLIGGAGADVLIGGMGKDRLAGGSGLDQFVFADGETSALRRQSDVITDFSHAQADRIKLNRMDANTGIAGDQKFAFIGAGAFTGVAGQLHYVHDNGNTFVEGDTNGDGLADFAIQVEGIINLVGADFVL